jgi:hypothetical protein
MTSEKQKQTTDQYRDNWDAIFDRNLMAQDKLANKVVQQIQDHIAINATNGEEQITIKTKWEI